MLLYYWVSSGPPSSFYIAPRTLQTCFLPDISLKGGLISESFSLWLKSSKKRLKVNPRLQVECFKIKSRPCQDQVKAMSRPWLSRPFLSRTCLARPRFTKLYSSRPCLSRPFCWDHVWQNHVCQDHVWLAQVCPDHVCLDHVCPDHIFWTMYVKTMFSNQFWSNFNQFQQIWSCLINFDQVWSSLI